MLDGKFSNSSTLMNVLLFIMLVYCQRIDPSILKEHFIDTSTKSHWSIEWDTQGSKFYLQVLYSTISNIDRNF